MMAPIVDNNQFELPAVETPGKKRKRNTETNPFLAFSDQTFSIPSSTPIHSKQIDGSAFENPSFRYNNNSSNKENYNIFSDSCMEVKSIAELAGENPYEVVRKPPNKKKKRNPDWEDSCFVNPGLNLNAADKPVVRNPFEVLRSEETAKRENESCFVNGALNIKGKDNGESLNPFEIARPTVGSVEIKDEGLKGIENPALELASYAIAVPFTPSINHRINFSELPTNALTPCSLLAKNLVFSPEPSTNSQAQDSTPLVTPKRNTTTTSRRKSLSIISEEPLDIGEELDCYQLELENSINEAKVRKQKTVVGSSAGGGRSAGSAHKSRRSLIDIKHISNLSAKLRQLDEDGAGDEVEPGVKNLKESEEINEASEERPTASQTTYTVLKETSIVKEEIRINISNPDVQFEEVDDFEDEEQDVDLFANPAPFQRAYRKKEDPKPGSEFKEPALPETAPSGKSHKVKDVIRRSFRKLMHPKHQELVNDTDAKPAKSEESSGLISSLRQSLRRKVGKAKPSEETGDNNKTDTSLEKETPKDSPLEMSIIGEEPRAVFRQPSSDESDDYKPIASGIATGDRIGTSLRSSLRRSTKDVKKHMMKTVFKKASEEK
ncbi:LOW QUALITY PROTEIN: uncharacterized protein LOC129756519 [Uranotaenia lowii]|uniref:LOW QUALITY PROTEIN: uncharacterized protein LOC129756519 n=1 Tax=Uranotaenia lowii TaxID=190385 RepID=UPI00247A88BC|nr:LOW QUALITY PROTEIN: uncharacterized protein LOC129756519 [Uranotaenia lowii]